MISPTLSIVIPVFNEANRLPARLPAYLNYLNVRLPNYELVLVNDGSTDGTALVLEGLAAKDERVRVVNLKENHGRGFGMKTGALAANGRYILETDADLPVSPDHIEKFLEYFKKHPDCDLIIGSRGLKESAFVKPQPKRREIAGNAFHILFGLIFGIRSKDVMCGFKLFRHNAAKSIFRHVYDERYLAAGEIVFAAKNLGYKMKDLPIAWEDNRDSKVKIFRDSVRTLGGMAAMLWRHWQGYYKN